MRSLWLVGSAFVLAACTSTHSDPPPTGIGTLQGSVGFCGPGVPPTLTRTVTVSRQGVEVTHADIHGATGTFSFKLLEGSYQLVLDGRSQPVSVQGGKVTKVTLGPTAPCL